MTQGPGCDVPSNASSCTASDGNCQSYWGAFSSDIVKGGCTAPQTFSAAACPTAGIAATCVHVPPNTENYAVFYPSKFPPETLAVLKSSCEKSPGGTWCVQ